MNVTASGGQRIEWSNLRDSLDLAAILTRLLGPAQGRRGERGRRLWWCCPFHDDRNPSLAVTPGQPWWRCYGCNAHGDAATFVMKLNGLTFPEAIAFLAGGPSAPLWPRKVGTAHPTTPRPPAAPAPRPSALDEPEALATLEAAERRLWDSEGAEDLAYLKGRGLAESTIRAARLGSTGPLALPGSPRGVVVPWWERGGKLSLVKVRQPEGCRPKYYEVFRCLPGIFHGNGPILAGVPLVIAEGEFDALLLGQELASVAATVTLGSASARPTSQTLGPMLVAYPWYVATDNDPAGDGAADGWPAGAIRIRPPGVFKDWTEAHQAGVGLRRWWFDVRAGNDRPPLFTWEEASRLRWGPAVGDPTPGLDVGTPFNPATATLGDPTR